MIKSVGWTSVLAARAHWLVPVLLALAIVILKDWPPPRCEGRK